MSYWSKAKKTARYGKRYARSRVNFYRRGIRNTRRINNKYGIVGLTPDHYVSPIDFVPYVNVANKGRQGYKLARTTQKVRKSRARKVRAVKGSYRAGTRSMKRGSYDDSLPNRRNKSSRRRRGRSSRYYYYKGKRYERKQYRR